MPQRWRVLAFDDEARAALAALHDRALAAADGTDAAGLDGALARREDELYAQLCALRDGNAEAPYAQFVRIATQRHALRALRATLVTDGLSAAAWAAFEAIMATRNETAIVELAGGALAAAQP